MENLLTASEVSYAQAARFILRASDSFTTSNQDDAFWFAATRGWLPENTNPQDLSRLDGISLLLMRAFNIEGGLMYSVTKNAHYAYRELVYKNIIQGNTDPFMIISGEQLVFFTGRVLAFREREDEAAARYALERRDAPVVKRPTPLSLDFGFLTTQQAIAFGNFKDRNDPLDEPEQNFEYRLGVTPRFLFILGNAGTFYASMGFTFWYDDEFFMIPEVLRTELNLRFGGWGLSFGRFAYSDPLAFIADSLYDGFQITNSSPAGHFGLGAWYTGMLYKNNANIIMSGSDRNLFILPIDEDDYANTYFAPRRFVAAFDWEHPSVGGLAQLNMSLIGQIDMNKDEEARVDSQYLILKLGLPLNNFTFVIGNAFGMIRSSNGLSAAWACELRLHIPFNDLNSILSFTGRFASGGGEESMFEGLGLGAFVPITTKYYGHIFKTSIIGITTIAVDYQIRFSEIYGSNINFTYFMRNDLSPVDHNLVVDSEEGKKLLGAEFYTQHNLSPFSDLQFVLGAGVFVPMFGDNWKDAKSIWRVDLTTIFALY